MKKEIRNNFAGILMLAAATAMSAAPVICPVTVMADSIISNTPVQGTLTVTKKDTSEASNSIAGAVYTAYKIMSLTPGANPGDYASYSITAPYSEILSGITPDNLGNYSAAKIEGLIKELEVISRTDTSGSVSEATDAAGTTSFTLDTGWYLIVETTTPPGSIAGMPFLAAVPSTDNVMSPDGTEAPGTEWIYNISAVPKSPKISIEKNIINAQAGKDSSFVDKNESYIGKNDTAAVNDYVNYAVTATVPEYGESYFHKDISPTFEFRDTMSPGLTVQNEGEHLVKVLIEGEEIPAESDGKINYKLTATPSDAENEADLILAFTNDFLLNTAYRGKEMTISYYAKVNENAVMGSAGNTNDVVMRFSDKPTTITSASPEGTEENPLPDTYVYTYGISVDKFAEESSVPLAGAEFSLYKDEALTKAVTDAAGAAIQTTNEDGSLLFRGIDAGTYYLKEVKSPAGYSLLANPIKVKILPLTDEEGQVINGEFTLEVNGENITATEGSHLTRLSVKDGISTIAVENHKGFSLPATGGSGILLTITISAAGLLAVSFFMTKSKKKEE